MKNILLALLILATTNINAQEKMMADTAAAYSIDGIVKEVLRVITGEEGKTRNWEAFRGLFLPTANFTILYHDSQFPEPVETVSLEELITLLHDEYYDQDFLEYETGKVVDEYNGIAQVFQSYYAKDTDGIVDKGITSYQLVFFNNRWWIANVIWTGNSNGVEVPDKYIQDR